MAASADEGMGVEEEMSFRIIRNPSWRMELLKPTHTKYCRHLIFSTLPSEFQEYDMSMLTFLHFALASLDILQSLDSLTPTEKQDIIETIYSLLLTDPAEASGFYGSQTLMFRDQEVSLPINLHASHVTMTFAALVSLLTLGDDLSRLDRRKMLRGISSLQNRNGSFRAGPSCCESDMRFVYSAVAVCYILNDFSEINIPALLKYIKASFTYEGSCGSGSWGTEGHAAYTYCAVASLVLLDKLNETLTKDEINRTQRWCLFRQLGGFTGRPNKEEDTCYSFWVGATLAMLDATNFSSCNLNIDYLLHNQNPFTGGVGKRDNEYADPLHTFTAFAGLSLAHYENLSPVNPVLAMTQEAVKHMKILQQTW